jgi:hypothetical protein
VYSASAPDGAPLIDWSRQNLLFGVDLDVRTAARVVEERATTANYPIRYRSARYCLRVLGLRTPIVQVFSIAVADVELTDALAQDLNVTNSKLHFCHSFWVDGQVLIESEHLGMSLSDSDFRECAVNVAEATNAFAPGLAERYGGRLAFDDAKEPEYEPASVAGIGFSL